MGTLGAPRSVTVGDLNADGKLRNTEIVLVVSAPAHASFVAIGNLGPNGIPDLVVAYSHSSSCLVLTGGGGGGFLITGFLPTPSFNQQCALAELNGDDNLDAVTVGGVVSVVFGDGFGGFGSFTAYAADVEANSLALVDLNNDGNLDVATANGSRAAASVLLGNGDGTFGLATNYATGADASSVAVADLDLDGMLDLATASISSSTVSLLSGNGDGTFDTKTDFDTGTLPRCMAVGDLNGDSRPDLVGRENSTVIVLVNSFTPVDVDPEIVPVRFALGPPQPNPFHARVTFDLAIPTPSPVRLEIYDLQGRWIRTLENGILPAGRYTRSWDGTAAGGSTAGTGVYLVSFSAPGIVQTRKILLTR